MVSAWSESYPPSLAQIKKRIKEGLGFSFSLGKTASRVSQTPWGGCLRPRGGGVSDPVPLHFQWGVRSPLFVDNFRLG
jgi:hypothetical protein